MKKNWVPPPPRSKSKYASGLLVQGIRVICAPSTFGNFQLYCQLDGKRLLSNAFQPRSKTKLSVQAWQIVYMWRGREVSYFSRRRGLNFTQYWNCLPTQATHTIFCYASAFIDYGKGNAGIYHGSTIQCYWNSTPTISFYHVKELKWQRKGTYYCFIVKKLQIANS